MKKNRKSVCLLFKIRHKRRIKSLIIVVILLDTLLLSNFASGKESNSEIIHSGSYGKGFRYNIQGFVYVHIEGDPYERGYQYGYLASAEIVDMINRWSNWGHAEKIMELFVIKNLPQNYDELSEQWWNICKSRAVRFFWKQYPEEYQQEMKGIGDGVRARGGTIHGRLVDYEDILTLNVIEETRRTLTNPGGRGQPIRVAFGSIKKQLFKGIIPEEYEPKHCSGFIATGDATIDGRIIMAHSTIFLPNYIPQRANIILDVQPSEGHRFVMTCFPGYIWSSQDFYENENGIVLMETTMPIQGPWRIRGTKPVGARARKAIQYSDSIDDVIQCFLDGNNGLYPNNWVMGDTKTGEIASLELALRNHAVTRTKNGFLWSCCNPKDAKVRWELFSIFSFGILGRIIFNKFQPSGKDLKFEELRDEYYGKIDVDIAKKIMSTEPICTATVDCKITDSRLVEDLGLWAHMGNPDGNHWKPTVETEKSLKGITEIPGTGWVKVFASKSQTLDLPNSNAKNDDSEKSKVLWTYQTDNTKNINYASSTVSGDTVYAITSSSSIYALDTNRGRLLWKRDIGEETVTPAVSKDLVFIGADKGISAVDKETGEVRWEQLVGDISSKPIVADNLVIASCLNGEVYAFDVDSGTIEWSYGFLDSAYVSELDDNVIYVGSGDACYALDVETREILWSYETDGPISTSPAINDDIVYFGSWDGNVYALDSDTGDFKWKYETGWGIDTTPAFSDELVYVGSNDNNFYCLNAEDGELEWFFNCKSAIHSSPTIYGDYVFFGSDDGRLYALEKETGDLMWSFTPGYSIEDDDVNNYITTPILSDPIAEDGMVYIGAKGTVYALDAQTIEKPKEIIEEPSILDFEIFVIILVIILAIILIIYFQNKKKRG